MDSIQIAAVANITLEPYFSSSIKAAFEKSDIGVKLTQIQFEEVIQRSDILSLADFVVVIIDYQSRYGNDCIDKKSIVEDTKGLYDKVTSLTNAHIIWFGFEKYSSYNKHYLGHIYRHLIDGINSEIAQHLCPSDSFVD